MLLEAQRRQRELAGAPLALVADLIVLIGPALRRYFHLHKQVITMSSESITSGIKVIKREDKSR